MEAWIGEQRRLQGYVAGIQAQAPGLAAELEALVTATQGVMILVYARRILEMVITDLCETALGRDRGTEPLQSLLQRLWKEGHLPEHIYTSMENLNRLGTYGAHPKDFSPNQVREALVTLQTLLEWYGPALQPVATHSATGSLAQPPNTQPLKLLEQWHNRLSRPVLLMALGLLLGAGGAITWLARPEVLPASAAKMDASGLIKAGYEAYQQGQYQRALAYYERCLAQDPSYAAAYNNRALVYQALKEWQAALTDANQAIALDPQYGVAYATRGHSFAQIGETAQALQDFERAIALRPDSRWSYVYRAALYRQQGQCPAALADLKQACERGHSDSCQATCP
jgi:tetratricopeptide (TPR) repeat protein